MSVFETLDFGLGLDVSGVQRGVSDFLQSMTGANAGAVAAQEKVEKLGATYEELRAKLHAAQDAQREQTALFTSGKISAEQYAAATEGLGEKISEADKKATAAKNDLTKAQSKLADETAKTGGALKAFGEIVTQSIEHPMKSAQLAVTTLLETMGPTAVGIGGIATAVIAAGVGIFKFGSDAGAAAEQLNNLAASTGLSARDVQGLSAIADQMGLSSQAAAKSIETLNVQLGSPEGGRFTKALVEFGVSLRDTQGHVRPTLDILDDFRTVLLAIPDPTERSQVAMAAFGRRGTELERILLGAGTSLKAFRDALADAGVVQTDVAIAKAAELDNRLDELGQNWIALKNAAKEAAVDTVSAALDMGHALGFLLDPFKELIDAAKTFASIGPRAFQLAGAGISVATGAGVEAPGPVPFVPAHSAVLLDRQRRDAQRDAALARVKATGSKATEEEIGLTEKIRVSDDNLKNARAKGSDEEFDRAVDIGTALRKQLADVKEAQKAEVERQKEAQKAEQERAKAFETAWLRNQSILYAEEFEYKKIGEEIRKVTAETAKFQSAIDTKGRAALAKSINEDVGGGLGIQGATAKHIIDDAKRAAKVDAETDKLDANSTLRDLKLQERTIAQMIPLRKRDRETVALMKIDAEFAVKQEELRVKYAEQRAVLEERIAAARLAGNERELAALERRRTVLDKDETSESQGLTELKGAEIVKAHREEYVRMAKTYRDEAGSIFDAITARGKGAFTSLQDWLEGFFLTRMRKLFQDMVEGFFSSFSSGGAGGGGFFGRIGNIFSPGGGGGGFGTPSFVPSSGGAASGGGFLSKLGGMFNFGRGGGAGSTLPSESGETAFEVMGTPKGTSMNLSGETAAGGFAKSTGGMALTAGGAMAGQMLLSDAWKRGSVLEGLAGGAVTGASFGMMVAGPIGAAVGAGIGAIGGAIAGLFGGGAKRREEERARRLDAQKAYHFDAPEAISHSEAFGAEGNVDVEQDLTGRFRALPSGRKAGSKGAVSFAPGSVVISLIDGSQAEAAGDRFVKRVTDGIMKAGTMLGDNIAWAAS